MSIQSTMDITREQAIERINLICKLVKKEDYVGVEAVTNEDLPPLNVPIYEKIKKCTNSMLETIMDSPFYRHSMFDNYSIID